MKVDRPNFPTNKLIFQNGINEMRTKDKHVTRRWIGLALVAILALSGIFAWNSNTIATVFERLTPPQLPPAPTIRSTRALDQNWSDETRAKFHHISQGTSTFPVPLSWLMALEQPVSSPLKLLVPGAKPAFFETDHLRRFGFIASPRSADNPNGLPIGFATTPFQNLPGVSTTATSLGLTCAACHTGHFTYGGTEFIVDGGPSTVDLDGFSNALGAALGQTMLSAALPTPNRRFARFARAVLGEAYTDTARAQLKTDLKAVLEAAPTDQFEVIEGHGRLDALNRIGNQVFSQNVNRPQNYTPISAPVNFPHIWTAMWFDWVQYDGSIMRPLVRNAGEALGVHAHVNMTAPLNQGRFQSAVPVANLDWIENTLSGADHPTEKRQFGGLVSPRWPEELPPVDTALRDKGEALYLKHCKGCHLPPVDSDAFWEGRHFRKINYEQGGVQKETRESYLNLHIIPLHVVDTDPAQANILLNRTVDTAGDVETGAKPLGISATLCVPRPATENGKAFARGPGPKADLIEIQVSDGPRQKFALALGALVQQVNDTWFDTARIPEQDRAEFEGERPNCLQAHAAYKARPLNGVWATAPFLHNGAVPTLDDLLRPADERPRFVQLGTLEFDPVKVGIKQPDLPKDSYPPYRNGHFILDTSLPGNLNTGHAFGASANGDKNGVIGPHFNDEERAALIEFLKTL